MTERTTRSVGLVAVDWSTAGVAGAIAWWRLSGNVDVEKLRETWAEAGLSEKMMPSEATPLRAMRRALTEMSSKHRLVRNFGAVWALVDERVKDDEPEYTQMLRAKIKEDQALEVLLAREQGLGDRLREGYERHLGMLTQDDISVWLGSEVMPRLKAVPLRDTGGVYFLPRAELYEWREIAGALGKVSAHSLYEVPALKTDEAVTAVMDSLRREAETEITAIQRELDGGDLGGRALQTRGKRCEAMAAKLGAYEELLGKEVEGLRDRIQGLSAGVAAAALVAMGDDAAQTT